LDGLAEKKESSKKRSRPEYSNDEENGIKLKRAKLKLAAWYHSTHPNIAPSYVEMTSEQLISVEKKLNC
tara:strand:- start:160 stop:366 length:207 start_codon:yes stop_codon:yes gene_type:complete